MIITPSYNGNFFEDTSIEIVDKILLNLDLEDVLTAELVCTVWHQVSCANKEIWVRIANQRLLDYDSISSIKVQVLTSFVPFCKAAFEIFPEIIKNIPDDINPARQRFLINKETNKVQKTEIPIMVLLEKYLQIDQPDLSLDDLLKHCVDRNIKYIPSLQVWIESGIHFSDEFYDRAWMKHFNLMRQIQELFMIRVKDKSLYTFNASNGVSNNFIKKLELLDRIYKARFKFMEYIAPHINNPSYQSIHFLCSMYARKQWIKDFEIINLDRYEKDIHFEEIQLNIAYPPFIHLLIKKLDDEQFSTLKENFNIADELPENNDFEIYAKKAMNESFKESILSIRSI